ncbi:glycosyl hydrolase [Herbiconiux sp. A18JL235]|uniref:Glycosyl hydrolase n=1 Tax=Herbiconiux sp. A18JL235 TaxID=3152363 RepID=A0AB39BN62_9MICO
MSVEDLKRLLTSPSIEYRPEIRWWLAEGLHTDATLRHEIAAARRLGFGGLEFLAMDEEAIDHRRYGWGSEEWVHDNRIIVDETTERGMAVSFTSGTNWSNANLPTIDPDHPAAAQELNVVTERLSGGETRTGPLSQIDLAAIAVPDGMPMHRESGSRQHFVAVVAARVVETDSGSAPVLDVTSVVDLSAHVDDGRLEWTAPEGEWLLFTYWMHGTGQTASPSVQTNYTVNYLDRAGIDAVIHYWDTVVLTPELRSAIRKNGRAQMYMDSLELWTFGMGGLFWGATVYDEFRRRRGYAIDPWLPFLTRDVQIMASSTVYHHEPAPEYALTVAKVRHDYVETLTDLYIENMLRPFAAFLHENAMELRAEISYGMPFELTRPGIEVDGIENESLEFAAQIDAYRLLAGPAHLFGKQYSSETGATTRNHMLDHRFYDQIIATQLAAGVTKTVMHGWASTAGAEGATHWPGHEGMLSVFSERFDERQPAAEFYPLWTEALARIQAVLRQGVPRIDVGILRTDHFTDNGSGMAFLDDTGRRIPDEEAYGRMWMRDRENHWWRDLQLQDAGWTYEFFDGSLLLHDEVSLGGGLVQPDGPGYQALLVYQAGLDADVAALLLRWAQAGLPVVLVHGASELKLLTEKRYINHARAASHTPGLDGRDDELAAVIAELLRQPSVREADGPDNALEALRSLGVRGRAEFADENRTVLTHLRVDGELSHVYAYHFLYETGEDTVVEITLDGEGAVHRIDPWSGELHAYPEARSVDGLTVIRAALAPGETALWTLDRSATPLVFSEETDTIAALDEWSIAVESWDAGEDVLITEDRGLGYETREIRPTTAVTTLRSSTTQLAPWRRIEDIGAAVSGVGQYTVRFTLDDAPTGAERFVLDLGSTAGGLGSVSVGGRPPRGFDTSAPRVDITADLRAGDNEIVVRVASSLNNRLIARGYYDDMPDIVGTLLTGVPSNQATTVRDHGLLGPVRLERITTTH